MPGLLFLPRIHLLALWWQHFVLPAIQICNSLVRQYPTSAARRFHPPPPQQQATPPWLLPLPGLGVEEVAEQKARQESPFSAEESLAIAAGYVLCLAGLTQDHVIQASFYGSSIRATGCKVGRLMSCSRPRTWQKISKWSGPHTEGQQAQKAMQEPCLPIKDPEDHVANLSSQGNLILSITPKKTGTLQQAYHWLHTWDAISTTENHTSPDLVYYKQSLPF